MKIVLTGAGGGHFYPLIAVAESLRKEVFNQKLVSPEIYFFSDAPYNEKSLFDLRIKFIQIPSGKFTVYPSIDNFFSIFKNIFGIFVSIFKLYNIYPDVVFAKGGYASFPVIIAAKLLAIPIVVHESDSVAGRTTIFAGKIAKRVAISYKEASKYFNNKNIALVGLPIMERKLPPVGYKRVWEKKDRYTIFILGGSQGSQRINSEIIDLLPSLLDKYDIVHQVGQNNLEDMKVLSNSVIKTHPFKDRYYIQGFLDVSIFYPKVDLMITRAGSSLFEIALWQLPSIVIPIPENISRDQKSNAYTYAREQAGAVLEEDNFTKEIFLKTLSDILNNKENYEKMITGCHYFDYTRDAGSVIAKEIIKIALTHY